MSILVAKTGQKGDKTGMHRGRVCHITSAHSQKDVRIFQKECVSLAKNGYEVFLVAPGGSGKENGVNIRGFGEKEEKRWRRILFSSKKAYRLAKEIDAEIYHFHDPELLPYGWLLKRSGKKVIFDSHENLFQLMRDKSYIPSVARACFNSAFNILLNWICKKLDAVISVDPQICKEYKRINKNTVLITNYPILETGLQSGNKNPVGMAFAGGVDRQWNHDAIIRAMEKLKSKAAYTICGKADSQYLVQLKQLPSWEQVNFCGEVSHDEALRVLRGNSIGMALCSYSKNTNQKKGTLGNTKLFEIMMAGIPVICTRFELWEKIINKYQCGICVDDPQNEEEIAQAAAYLLEHPQEAEKMGGGGCRAVKEKFNWLHEEKKLLELYHKL